MARFFCERCQKESSFLPIYLVTKIAGVSRSTIYYWMDHAWVHWRELPSGRRIICEDCLSQPASHSPEPASQRIKPTHFLS